MDFDFLGSSSFWSGMGESLRWERCDWRNRRSATGGSYFLPNEKIRIARRISETRKEERRNRNFIIRPRRRETEMLTLYTVLYECTSIRKETSASSSIISITLRVKVSQEILARVDPLVTWNSFLQLIVLFLFNTMPKPNTIQD